MKKGFFDLTLFFTIITLTTLGIIMIYSSSNIWAEYKYDDAFKFLKAQSIFAILGIITMIIVSNIPYTIYKNKANLILSVCFILLILVLIPGVGVVRGGSRSWFGIGSFGIQPSEFMKLGMIIFLAKYLEKSRKQITKFFKGIFPALFVVLLSFGLIMLQPDFGTGMVLVINAFAMFFIAGVPISFFVKLGVLGVLGIVGLIISAPYRLERITSFVDPWKDPLGSGFQIIQSLFALGPSGVLGFGFGSSIQKHFYLPEPQTDFIFSIITEELGFFGVMLILTLYGLLVIRCFKIANNSNNLFAKYLVFGIIAQIIIQTLINLSVVTGILPVTGITLPFLSYGGSSLVVILISMGVVLNVSKYQT